MCFSTGLRCTWAWGSGRDIIAEVLRESGSETRVRLRLVVTWTALCGSFYVQTGARERELAKKSEP